MQIDSNQYLDECNSFLCNRQFSKAEKSLDKSFEIDCSYYNLNIDDSLLKISFNLTQYGMDLDESIDKFIIKVINIIEVYVENVSSIDSVMRDKFSKFITTLNLLLSLGRNTKQWGLIYKTRSVVYIILNDKLNAFKSIKSALYFDKSNKTKSLFFELTKEYGKNYRIDKGDFNFKLLDNIFFKSVQVDVDDNAPRNKKYLIDGKSVYVEDIAVNYYTNKGFSSFRSDSCFFGFTTNVFFGDINRTNFYDFNDDDIYKKNILKRINECKKSNTSYFIKKYHNSYLLLKNSENNPFQYQIDFVEVYGYDEWIKILNAMDINNCLKFIAEAQVQGIDQRLPISGWPDLFVYNDDVFFFVEVKSTNDKLSYRQKWWHMYISDELNIPIVIFMVNKSESQIKSMKRQYFV